MKTVRASLIEYEPASHEDRRNPGVLKKVLATKADLASGQVPMLNWSLLRKGKSFQRHYHEDMQEIFVILSGEANMTIESSQSNDMSSGASQTVQLSAGDAIIIDPGEIHSMDNSSDQDVEYLVFGIAAGIGGKTIVVED